MREEASLAAALQEAPCEVAWDRVSVDRLRLLTLGIALRPGSRIPDTMLGPVPLRSLLRLGHHRGGNCAPVRTSDG